MGVCTACAIKSDGDAVACIHASTARVFETTVDASGYAATPGTRWHGRDVAVVDIVGLPRGLTPSFTDDDTYYCRIDVMPKDWQWRTVDEWFPKHFYSGGSAGIVQCRPVPEPPGVVETIVGALNDVDNIGPLAIAETVRDRLRAAGHLAEGTS